MNETALPLVDLVAYLRVYSLLINAGVSLMRSMDVLTGHITHPELRAAHLDVMRQVEEGSTLSAAMMAHPSVFSGFLIYLVRAGEVGGVLDVTMERAADFYEQQVVLQRDRTVQQAAALVLGRGDEERYGAAMAEAEQLTVLQYFCTMFGTMLGAGVPILLTMQTAADILPESMAEAVRAMAVALREKEVSSLAPRFAAAGFPAEVVTLVDIGEQCGTLDRTMVRAGDILGARVQGLLLRALEG